MNKFQQNLSASNKAIKEARAKIIAEDVKTSQETLIADLSTELRNLQRKKMDLEDLSPDSALSLNPTKNDFDAKVWVKTMQDVKIEILNKKVEVATAMETLKEYFGEENEQ